MSTRGRLSAAALLLAVIAAALGAATTASAGDGAVSSPARPTVACRGRAIRTSAPRACTSSVVGQAHVLRATNPFRRISAGAWTTAPSPGVLGFAAMIDSGGATSCPRPPPADNHSRAPPAP